MTALSSHRIDLARARLCVVALAAIAVGLVFAAPATAQRISLQDLLDRIKALEAAGLAGQQCPPGQFVRGFDISGRIVCGDPAGAGGEPPPDDPIPLPVGQTVQDRLNAVIGNEFPTTFPFDETLDTGGRSLRVTATINLLGFALCDPADPDAAPNPTPAPGTTVYGCVNAAAANVTASPDLKTLTAVVTIPVIFVDIGGNWDTSIPLVQGSLDGFIRFTNVTATLTAPLSDAGPGLVTAGPIASLDIGFSDSTVDIDFNNSLVNSVARVVISLVSNSIFSAAVSDLKDTLTAFLNPELQAANPISVPVP